MERSVSLDMLRQKESPTRSRRKVVQRISSTIERVYTIGLCISRFFSEKVYKGKLGSKHAVKFSKGTWHQIKIQERKDPSRGIVQKCAPHERSPCGPKYEERSHEETLHQEGCARRAAWDLANFFTSSGIRTKTTFFSPTEGWEDKK